MTKCRTEENNDITILVDMDDVLEDLLVAWCNWLNQEYNINVNPENIKTWDVTEYFPELSKEEVFKPMSSVEFWETVQPKKGAVKYLKRLIDEGYNVYICTASDFGSVAHKFKCVIQKYFPFISWHQIIIAAKKQMIKGDILVDDGVHNLVGGDYEKILMSAPHNEWYDEKEKGILRAKNWAEVYTLIKQITKNKLRRE